MARYRVTQHAMLRWLERVEGLSDEIAHLRSDGFTEGAILAAMCDQFGFSSAELTRRIVTPACAAAIAVGASSYRDDKATRYFNPGVVMTVVA